MSLRSMTTRHNLISWLASCFFAAVLLAPVGARADDEADCLAQAQAQPQAALARAEVWAKGNGGVPARLCQAAALYESGSYRAALRAFLDLAGSDHRRGAAFTASLYARAGWAALRLGDAVEAETLYGKAIGLAPDDADLRLDRAFARVDQERYWDAIADLDVALRVAPDRADLYLYRAQARRELGQRGPALDDIAEALKREPQNAEALLLRGNLAAQEGDVAAARRDWSAARAVAPASPAGRDAVDNLARLDRAEAAARDKQPAK